MPPSPAKIYTRAHTHTHDGVDDNGVDDNGVDDGDGDDGEVSTTPLFHKHQHRHPHHCSRLRRHVPYSAHICQKELMSH